jgi:hypothetical protein
MGVIIWNSFKAIVLQPEIQPTLQFSARENPDAVREFPYLL